MKRKNYSITVVFLTLSVMLLSCTAIQDYGSTNQRHKSDDPRESRAVSRTSGNVVVTCLGEGKTLSEATSNALRSGIEQTYGAFVSSNTTLLNDNIVKDEVISVSSGNVLAYNIMSQSNIDGKYLVTVQAEISQSKLTTFAKSKGARTEINTSALARNIKLARFYKENEEKAFKHLSAVLKEMAPFCIDYILKTTEPVKTTENGREFWVVNTWVGYKYNENFKAAEDMILQTVKSLSMTQSEAEQYESLGEDVYKTYYKGNVFLLRTKAIDWNDKWTFSDPYKIRIDNIVKEIVKENFILFENGKDVTPILLRELDTWSSSKKNKKTNAYYARESSENYTYYDRCNHGGYIDKEDVKKYGFRISDDEHWYCVYEKVLSLNELESFNANYQIISKHQKK